MAWIPVQLICFAPAEHLAQHFPQTHAEDQEGFGQRIAKAGREESS